MKCPDSEYVPKRITNPDRAKELFAKAAETAKAKYAELVERASK